MSTSKSLFVTIKATLNCNLACQYCYGRDNNSVGREMDDSEIKTGLKFIGEYAKLAGAKYLSLCWHGGEPLLFSPQRLDALCEYAVNMFNGLGIKCVFGVQTNGILLRPQYYQLIHKYFDSYVGVSLDLYSDFRGFRSGLDSTDLVVRNIDNTLKAGIKCGAINLITQRNIHHIKDIYNFYKERHMNVRLARVFPISRDFDINNPMYVSDEAFANAMIQYFDLWANDETPAYNSDIVKLVCDVLLGKPSICLRERNCQDRYLALSPGGDIYPCAEFDVPESIIGNIYSQTPLEFFESERRTSIYKKAPIPSECSSCKYEIICHGGCLRERFMVGYPFRCKANMMYWNHIENWLKEKGASLYMLKGLSKEESIGVISTIFQKR